MASWVVQAALVLAFSAVAFGDLRFNSHQGRNYVHNMHHDQGLEADGHLVPCNKTDPPFTFSWTPGTIKLGDTVTFHFSMTPTVSLTRGTAEITIWLPGYQDPIYQATQAFTCDDIHQVFKTLCPFKKNVAVNVPQYKLFIKPSWPLPGGKFTVKGRVMNENKQEFICISGTISISND